MNKQNHSLLFDFSKKKENNISDTASSKYRRCCNTIVLPLDINIL